MRESQYFHLFLSFPAARNLFLNFSLHPCLQFSASLPLPHIQDYFLTMVPWLYLKKSVTSQWNGNCALNSNACRRDAISLLLIFADSVACGIQFEDSCLQTHLFLLCTVLECLEEMRLSFFSPSVSLSNMQQGRKETDGQHGDLGIYLRAISYHCGCIDCGFMQEDLCG